MKCAAHDSGRPMTGSAMINRLFGCLIAVVLTAVMSIAVNPTALAAAPTPNPIPPRWELDFKVLHNLRLLRIGSDHYWFMTYQVTNTTGDDQTFVPDAVLYTDAGEIIQDAEVDFSVTRTILNLLQNEFLESKTQIIGTLRQGKENAKDGLLVWKAQSLDIDHVSVFVSGFSSETQVAVNASTGAESIVRKTLSLEYKVPGDPLGDVANPVMFHQQRWIMR